LLTCAIAFAAVAVHAARLLSGDPDSYETMARFGYRSAWAVWDGDRWALLTSAFLHADLLHLAFNLCWLWMLGRACERALGPLLFALLVAGAAWTASAAQLAVAGETAIGLSGTGFALFAFAWLAPRMRGTVDGPLAALFLGWMAFGLVASSTGWIDVANTVHFAGLAFGAAAAGVARPRWRIAGAAAVAALVAAVTLATIRAPWSPRWHSLRGEHAYESGRYEEAVEAYSCALEVDASYYWALAGRGQARRMLHEYERAIDDFSAALERDPAYVLALDERGWCRIPAEEYEAAAADFERAIELDGEDTWRLAGLGCARRELGQLEPAIESLRRAIELDPSNGHAHHELAIALYRAGQWKLSLAAAREALGKSGGDPATNWCLVAMNLWQLGEKSEARDALAKAQRLSGSGDPSGLRWEMEWLMGGNR